jgi:hypothetical protein
VTFDETLIPPGGLCYQVVDLEPGEVLSDDWERFGQDQREFKFGKTAKQVLCPYWFKTSHGTVRCERLDVEVYDDNGDFELTRALAKAHFGEDEVWQHVQFSFLLSDEIKICDINEDVDQPSPPCARTR